MVCLDGLPDLNNLPSNIQELQAILEKEEQRLREFKEEERKRRQEKFRARKARQRQQQHQHDQAQEVATPANSQEGEGAKAAEEAEGELVALLDGVSTELENSGEAEDLEALRHNLAIAKEIAAMEPELSKRSLVAKMETARRKIEELEQKAQHMEEEAAKRRAEAVEAQSDASESCTSEEMRIEAEIRELELFLQKHEGKEGKVVDGGVRSTGAASLRPSCSALSVATTADIAACDSASAAGGSTTASGCTSPASCSARLEAVPLVPEAATAAEVAPPKAAAKGKGKGRGSPGKGKGKGAPPPPPKSTLPKAAPAPPKASHLVHLHWKVSHEPEDISKMDQTFFKRLEDLRPFGCEDSDPEDLPELVVPQRPNTIFRPLADVVMPPQEVLDHYFAKSTTRSSWVPQEATARDKGAADRHKPMLDEKRLNMLGIMIQKHLMTHKGISNIEAILSIKCSVLRCDFSVVRLEGLSVIRTVLRQHEKDSRPVCAFVEAHGEAALDNLEFPEHHRLVFELSKVPQIDERLECMLFCISFKESIGSCQRSLKALRKALEMLNAKRDTIRRFFVTAHRLGQSLNRESNAPKAPNGFQLSTLEKLSQTKSTKFPKLSILHFVLALMSRGDAQALFNAEDLALLQSAKALKTHKVFQDCVELAQGIYCVQQICETGKYTSPFSGQAVKIERRRKSQPPQPLEPAEPAVDTDDRFHEVMQDFVDHHLEDAEDTAEGAFNVILTYKELALFFDDLPSVYPPPKNETDPRKDLCDIFYRFAEDIRRHREEVESEKLRELIAASNASELPLQRNRSFVDAVSPRGLERHRSSAGTGSPRSSRGLPPQLPVSSPPHAPSSWRLTGSPLDLGEASSFMPLMQPHELHFTPKGNELDSSAKSHSFHSPAPSFHMSPASSLHH